VQKQYTKKVIRKALGGLRQAADKSIKKDADMRKALQF
jgi:hypothetical protein